MMPKTIYNYNGENTNSKLSNIIIAGWHHDSNKGDSAILIALTRFFKKRCNCKIDIYLQVPPESISWCSALKHYCSAEGELSTLAPLMYLNQKFLLPYKIIRAGFVMLRSLLLLISPKLARLIFSKSEKKTIDAYLKSDIVIGKGGHYLYYLGGIFNIFRMWKQLLPFLLAIRLRKPYVLAGLSVGPFRNLLSRFFVRYVFSRATAISVREYESFNVIKNMGNFSNVAMSTDLALSLDVSQFVCERNKINKKLNNNKILVVPRAFFPDDLDKNKYRKYVKTMACVIDQLSVAHEVTFVTTARDENGAEDDMQAVYDILGLVRETKNIAVIKEDLSPISLIKLFTKHDIVIGTRLHSIIFSIIAERPFVAISYFGPKMSIVSDLGLGELLININMLSCETIVLKIKTILNNYDEWILIVKNVKQRAKDMALRDIAIENALKILNMKDGDTTCLIR